jgi:septal ring factor EnvC (AmiA/AmiB activator)
VSYGIGFMIEVLVAILLGITICYCVVLNNSLKRLKADEHALKATIAELITATEIAERAVTGLKETARECEETLGERLNTANRFSENLTRQVKGGEAVMNRLARVVAAGNPASEQLAASDSSDPKAIAAAARSFTDRQRERTGTLAA